MFLASCGGEEPPKPPPEPVDEFVSTAVPAPLPVVPKITAIGAGDAADVELRFFGVGELHKGFLSDPALVGKLGKDLGACVQGTAQVVIRWSNDERVGWIQLKVPPEGLNCMPEPHADGGWDLAPLTPVTQALAQYRDGAAANYDFRFASFHVGTSFTRGANQCLLRIAGQHPPDGTAFSPCVDIAGVPACAGLDEDSGVVRLPHDGRAGSTISACFAR
ncbi:MAG: hypothetical protein EP330_24145 [Deltaproteobacteria bacterium]|nr:MAG: hypothetical protein EP330_24145 [Deltaproteobacteria bacterium]